MWAMTPKFRIFGIGESTIFLPREMGEGLICLCHSLLILPLLYRSSRIIKIVCKFFGQPLGHRLSFLSPRRFNYPSYGKRGAPFRSDFHWNLVVSSADSL